MRMIDADAIVVPKLDLKGRDLFNQGYCQGKTDGILEVKVLAPTVDAAPVVRGFWKEFSRSALVNWKDGEPVWADRAVYRCSECNFGTIIKHNYCPRCGAKNLEASPDGDAK